MFRTKHSSRRAEESGQQEPGRLVGAVAQPRGPHGSLERGALEDRHVRLARLRHRRLRARRHGRHEEHRHERAGAGRVRPHGQDPGRRLQAARRRERPDPEPLAARERSRLHAPRSTTSSPASRSWPPSRTSARRSTPATRARSPRTGTRRSSSSRSAATRTRRSTRSTRSSTQVAAAQRAHPQLLHRRVRRRERGQGGRDRLRGRPGEGRPALAPDHADHPRDRLRRARGGGHPAAARADRRLRDVRAGRAAQPRPAGGDAGRRRWCS